MTAKITRLRIAGFKSFADPATVEILPGLTGIVGPNGCGKSNVVEALRWAMGESSARALRGGELDDLIFAGTSARPARNLAEVSLWLESATGLAPAPFAETAELEISRRAERGAGSDFRINGKSFRARDVTTLFADLSSGARSSSIVSQNRVGALINAKPEERRALLEEAAGITGLHVRRHDAELKLRQTENNMARAEDLRVQLEARLSSLGEQSTQAKRYRTLAASLRDDEEKLQALLHARAEHAVRQTAQDLTAARAQLEEATILAHTAKEAEARHAAALGPARTVTDSARTRLERLRVQCEGAAQAAEQAQTALEAALGRLEQGQQDAQGAAERLEEAEAALKRDIVEADTLSAERKVLPEKWVQAEAAIETTRQKLIEAENAVKICDETLLKTRLEADSRQKAQEASQRHIVALTNEIQTLEQDLARLQADLPSDDDTARLEEKHAAAEQNLQAAQEAVETAQAEHQEARLAAELAEQAAQKAEQSAQDNQAEQNRLSSRIAALTEQATKLRQQKDESARHILADDARATLTQNQEQAEAAAKTAHSEEERARLLAAEAESHHLKTVSEHQNGAQRAALVEQEKQSAESAAARANHQYEQARKAHEAAIALQLPAGTLEKARHDSEEAAKRLTVLQERLAELEERIGLLRQQRAERETQVTHVEAELLRLTAQRDGLDATTDDEAIPSPLIERLDVPEELTAAIAAALSEALEASLERDDSPRSWHHLSDIAPLSLPAGATPLSQLLVPPEALKRCFDAIGLIEAENGAALQKQLQPGQCLVTCDGALWRWDGYREAGNRPSRAAQILVRRRQFAELTQQIASYGKELPAFRANLDETRKSFSEIDTQLNAARAERPPLERALSQNRAKETELSSRQDNAALRLEAATRHVEEAKTNFEEAQSRLVSAQEAAKALPDVRALQAVESTAQQEAKNARAASEAASRQRASAQKHEQDAREALRQALLRHQSASDRIETLTPALANMQEDLAQAQSALQINEAKNATLDPTKVRAEAQRCRNVRQEAEQRIEAAKNALAQNARHVADLTQRHRELSERRIALKGRIDALTPRLENQSQSLQTAQAQAEALPVPPALAPIEQAAREAQDALRDARAQSDEARASLAALTAETVRIDERWEAGQARIAEGSRRLETLRRDHATLRQRLGELQSAHLEAAALPEQLLSANAAQQETLAKAQLEWEEAERALYAAETQLEEIRGSLQAEEKRATTAREAEIRLLERLEQAKAAQEALLAAGPPPEMSPPDDLSEQAEAALRRRLARALRERDALGPVNLRAEQEHDEASTQAETLAREHADLQSAINRLRGSIGNLNREGRTRLQAVFAEVDQHFQSLFARMFGGGRAHLGMVGSDDPLEAGLEIFAQPPGKKLSTLSLLSGGEQALTALSLIFATFRCQPAPICVLDEVDAPLDDANVERLCGLIRDMTQEADTRFIVVTHHQLTMAHMDRLFGVTMQERGVSQVLSVDLSRATAFIDGENSVQVS
ncbi:AAA family ATPase [Kozakia baliensis]|uniref:AAA family ATPase n=1 Tax=Kozakia baliensis TaxID=153496 RepID=UPI00345B4DFE